MITGELKNRIDSLWEIFWTGGLTNPLDVIEQITYLMFIHDLDDSDNLHAKEAAMLGLPYQSIFADEVKVGDRLIDGKQLKWSTFHHFPAGKMYAIVQEWVFPFIKDLHGNKNSAYSKYRCVCLHALCGPNRRFLPGIHVGRQHRRRKDLFRTRGRHVWKTGCQDPCDRSGIRSPESVCQGRKRKHDLRGKAIDQLR